MLCENASISALRESDQRRCDSSAGFGRSVSCTERIHPQNDSDFRRNPASREYALRRGHTVDDRERNPHELATKRPSGVRNAARGESPAHTAFILQEGEGRRSYRTPPGLERPLQDRENVIVRSMSGGMELSMMDYNLPLEWRPMETGVLPRGSSPVRFVGRACRLDTCLPEEASSSYSREKGPQGNLRQGSRREQAGTYPLSPSSAEVADLAQYYEQKHGNQEDAWGLSPFRTGPAAQTNPSLPSSRRASYSNLRVLPSRAGTSGNFDTTATSPSISDRSTSPIQPSDQPRALPDEGEWREEQWEHPHSIQQHLPPSSALASRLQRSSSSSPSFALPALASYPPDEQLPSSDAQEHRRHEHVPAGVGGYHCTGGTGVTPPRQHQQQVLSETQQQHYRQLQQQRQLRRYASEGPERHSRGTHRGSSLLHALHNQHQQQQQKELREQGAGARRSVRQLSLPPRSSTPSPSSPTPPPAPWSSAATSPTFPSASSSCLSSPTNSVGTISEGLISAPGSPAVRTRFGIEEKGLAGRIKGVAARTGTVPAGKGGQWVRVGYKDGEDADAEESAEDADDSGMAWVCEGQWDSGDSPSVAPAQKHPFGRSKPASLLPTAPSVYPSSVPSESTSSFHSSSTGRSGNPPPHRSSSFTGADAAGCRTEPNNRTSPSANQQQAEARAGSDQYRQLSFGGTRPRNQQQEGESSGKPNSGSRLGRQSSFGSFFHRKKSVFSVNLSGSPRPPSPPSNQEPTPVLVSPRHLKSSHRQQGELQQQRQQVSPFAHLTWDD